MCSPEGREIGLAALQQRLGAFGLLSSGEERGVYFIKDAHLVLGFTDRGERIVERVLASSSSAHRRTSVSNSSSGTTALTSPHSSACCAE
jgi:hypothetical protein